MELLNKLYEIVQYSIAENFRGSKLSQMDNEIDIQKKNIPLYKIQNFVVEHSM